MLEEQVGVQVRQLDRVVDLLDLVVEATDVGVGDVGHLFEDELLDLGARDALDEQAGASVHEQVLAGAQLARRSARRRARATRSSSARPTISARRPSSSSSLKMTTSPWTSRPRASTTLSDSLSTTSWPRFIVVDLELGVDRDAHLAAGAEDVDGAVVVRAEERAVRRTAAS